MSPLPEFSKKPARPDGRQLPVVAHQDNAAARLLVVTLRTAMLIAIGHPAFVDDERCPAIHVELRLFPSVKPERRPDEHLRMMLGRVQRRALAVKEEPVNRGAFDARAFLKLARRAV